MADQRGEGARKLRFTPKGVVVIIVAVLALVFVFQNTGRRRTNLFFWHLDGPAWAGLLAVLAIGFIVGSAFPWFRRRGKDA